MLIPVFLSLALQSLLPGSNAQAFEQMIKAADSLSAYLKCLRELQAGNHEFSQASAQLRDKLVQYEMPEVDYFLDTFVADCALTLDSLLIKHPSKSVA